MDKRVISVDSVAQVCDVCGHPVERNQWGRFPKYHKHCRAVGRSQAMKGNANRKGKRRLSPFPGTWSNDITVDAYKNIQPDEVRRCAIAYWGEPAELAYFVFDHANDQFFEGRIPPPLVQLCRVMPYGHCIGLSHTSDIDRPVIDLFLSLWTRQEQPHWNIAAVMIHEMLHFYVHHVWRDRGQIWHRTSHNNELWLGKVRELSRIIGAPTDDEPFERWPHTIAADEARLDKTFSQAKWPW